jgi:16S rRNA G966 N2-methylase RsmD
VDDGIGDLRYNRDLLLGGSKRYEVLDLWEVQRYGTDSYASADYVSIFGLLPTEWHGRGIRLLGRTVVECTRDDLADAIASDIAAVCEAARRVAGAVVIDPFAGSGSTLYWMLRHLPGARGIGFESDDAVFELTRRNLSILGLPIEVLHADFLSGLSSLEVAADELVIVFIAPPWGDALDQSTGLDLRRTTPPICDIVDVLISRFANRLLFAIQVYEQLEATSLADLEARFDWSMLRIYDLNSPGDRHGLLLGGKRWSRELKTVTS